MEQEAAYLAALEMAESYRIADGFLEITYANGAAVLRYSSVHLPVENVRWVLTAIDGQPLPEGVEATAIFTPGGEGGENRVNGSAGCNSYFGGYTVDGNNLSMPGPFGTTQMMCEEGIMEVERSFLAGLEGAQTYQTLLNSLTIATASGSLNFRADRTPLIGPIWQLTSLGPNDSPQPPMAEANFTATFNRQLGMPSGVAAGGTGCNEYSAVYYSNLQQIKFNSAARSDEACPPALAEQMVTYFQGLTETRSYRILGNELQIFFGDQVLNFVATYPPGEEEEQPAGPLTPLNGTTWWLVSSDAFQVIPGSEVTAFFEINPDGLTGLINGSGGCNTYNAEIVGVFQVGPINATQSLCDTPAGVMEQEGAYFAALAVAQSFTHDLDGGTLVINTDLGALVYSSQGPEAVQPLPPTDTPEAVQPLPLAAIINAPTEGLVDQPIPFDGSASTPQDSIASYAWDFGDGMNAEGAIVEHAFSATGVYTVTLTVTDGGGDMNSTILGVTIN
jgi:heat shock protein HslJ